MTEIAGGKGTPRRKQVKKSGAAAAGDDRKLQAALKKMNVQPVTGVEEVNMFKEDGNVLHFGRPQGEFHRAFLWIKVEQAGGRGSDCSVQVEMVERCRENEGNIDRGDTGYQRKELPRNDRDIGDGSGDDVRWKEILAGTRATPLVAGRGNPTMRSLKRMRDAKRIAGIFSYIDLDLNVGVEAEIEHEPGSELSVRTSDRPGTASSLLSLQR